MNYIFPATYMSVSYSITALLIIFGLMGKVELAADIGIIQGAALATFYAFSANARNIILRKSSRLSLPDILYFRYFLVVPLGLIAIVLACVFIKTDIFLAGAVILRRCTEWLGEIRLSEMESKGDKKHSLNFLLSQAFLLLFVIIAGYIEKPAYFYPFVYVWAASPIWLTLGYGHIKRESTLKKILSVIPVYLPHFGSTVTIGISLYAFRLFLMILAGKSIAGELFTAFSIGGFMGSFFANVLGPSIVLYQFDQQHKRYPTTVRASILGLSVICAVLLGAVFLMGNEFAIITKRSLFFWQATSLSLLGGLIMIKAQEIRTRILQFNNDGDAFGPDLMVHVLLVTSIPALFFIGGIQLLPGLYLVNALIASMFYWSAEKDVSQGWFGKFFKQYQRKILYIIAFLIAFPLFFQLCGKIFSSQLPVWDSGGKITTLPLPVSVIACYAGLFILARYKEATLSLTLIFSTFVLMLITSVLSASGEDILEKGKLLLFLQFLLPVFALMLGQIFDNYTKDEPIVANAFLAVLLIVIPAQLISTWATSNSLLLTHDLYIFSIYQHWQYVPVIFSCMFIYSIYSLWNKSGYKYIFYFLSFAVGLYTTASLSMLAMFGFVAGLSSAALYHYLVKKDVKIIILSILSISLSYAYFHLMSKSNIIQLYEKFGGGYGQSGLKNVMQRFDYWSFYCNEIFSNIKIFFLGHAVPPSRDVATSAHNYYLDLIYNFGFISAVPIFYFIVYTLKLCISNCKSVVARSDILGLVIIVLYLVIADSNLKVTLREPYSGIFVFFVWGILISKLLNIKLSRTI